MPSDLGFAVALALPERCLDVVEHGHVRVIPVRTKWGDVTGSGQGLGLPSFRRPRTGDRSAASIEQRRLVGWRLG